MSKYDFYNTYLDIPNYAEKNNYKLVYGLLSLNEKIENYIDKKKFTIEINNNNGFVIVKFEDNIYIAICKKTVFVNSNSIEKLLNLTSDRKRLLLIYEHQYDFKKLKDFVQTHSSNINSISLQSFKINPLSHDFSPQVKVIDYDKELFPFTMIDKKNLKEIYYNDPLIAYLGLQPGQVIEILNPSSISGFFTDYRFIV